MKGFAAEDVNNYTTTINGGKITTNTVDADRLRANQFWVGGMIRSADYSGNTSGYVSNSDPAGFMLNGRAGTGDYNHPNIYGSYIRGGTIAATKLITTSTVCDEASGICGPSTVIAEGYIAGRQNANSGYGYTDISEVVGGRGVHTPNFDVSIVKENPRVQVSLSQDLYGKGTNINMAFQIVVYNNSYVEIGSYTVQTINDNIPDTEIYSRHFAGVKEIQLPINSFFKIRRTVSGFTGIINSVKMIVNATNI